jgi:hypothetical protein
MASWPSVISNADLAKMISGELPVTWGFTHPGVGWVSSRFTRSLDALLGAWKYYIPIHLLPLIFARWHLLRKSPLSSLLRVLLSSLRSASMIGGINWFGQLAFWAYVRYFNRYDNGMIITGGIVGCVTGILLEKPARRCEMCIWMLPRTMSCFLNFLKRREQLKIDPKRWYVLVFCVCMAALQYGLENMPETVRYRPVFAKFVGSN